MPKKNRRKKLSTSASLAAPGAAPSSGAIIAGVAALGVLALIVRSKMGNQSPVVTPGKEQNSTLPVQSQQNGFAGARSLFILGDSQMEVLGPLLKSGFQKRGMSVDYVFNRGWAMVHYAVANDKFGTSPASSTGSNKSGQDNIVKKGLITADAVLIQLGTNDALSGATCGQLAVAFERLRKLCGVDKPIVFVGPAMMASVAQIEPLKSKMNAQQIKVITDGAREKGITANACLKELCSNVGVQYVESSNFITSGWYDGVHFNTPVYTAWANGILNQTANIA